MNRILVLFTLCLTALSIQCDEDKIYIKVIKESVNDCEEESFLIKNQGQVVVRSPTFAEWEREEFEYCLPRNANSQYSLILRDRYGDSWSAGSYMEIRGIYGNLFFKNMMTEDEEEEYTLSLYYAIAKNAAWKITNSFSANWKDFSFDDSAWSAVAFTPTAVTGTQYLRKQFIGLSDMAAYETRILYQWGIVVYVNGVEVYRDNMPAGEVTSETPATGGYPNLDYHGFIRPGLEVAAANGVMAIELHFMQAAATLEFNAFVALLAPTAEDTSCFILSEGIAIDAEVANAERVLDFDKETFASQHVSESSPLDVVFSFSQTKPYVNGLRIWPSTEAARAPSSFTWSGKNGEEAYHDVMNIVDVTYAANTNHYAYGFFAAGFYKTYKLHVTATASGILDLFEAQPMVCAAGAPTTIEFASAAYTFNALFDEVLVRPKLTEFTQCSVQPALPAGVSINAATCVISGISTVGLPLTTFTVTSIMGNRTYQGSFGLTVNLCATAMIDLRRIYKYSAGNEYFSITDSAGTTVYSIQAQTSQRASSTTHTYMCLTADEFTIHMDCTSAYWYRDSFLFVDLMLSPTESQTIARARHDSKLGLETVVFSTKFVIAPRATWHYKMGEVPAAWFNDAVTGWSEAAIGAFPESPNTIQLYKKTVTLSALPDTAGVVLSLRYKFGCVVYANGNELFRNGVAGELSTSSVAENIYSEVMYRVISLPPTMLRQGANTIAIAVVSTASTKTSFFDCFMRLMPAGQEYRILDDVTVTSTYSTGGKDMFSDYNGVNIYQFNCFSNNVAVKFGHDRREWINAVIIQLQSTQTTQYPRTFAFEARNTDDEAWTPLRTVGGLTWSQKGQVRKVWIPNTTPYNQYRFNNFGTENPNNCYLRIGRLAILSSAVPSDVPALKYVETGETITIYKDIEMAELYPNSEVYFDFSIQPELPAGITLDANSGIISGTATGFAALTTYTISAKKVTGEAVQATLALSVEICTGQHSLITLVARTDAWPKFSFYQLFEGRTTTGEPVAQNTEFPVITALNYVDWCLPNAVYTLALCDSKSDGWDNPAGWYLTVDVGEVKFEMGQVPNKVASVTTVFSSYLPFQVEYSDWAFAKTGVAADWNSVSFDASAWTVDKAAAIGTNDAITTYIRKEFSIPSLEDYSVLNVRVKYAGGVVAFVNGHKVARFNLADDYDANTLSLASRTDPYVSLFHVILNMVQAATDKNVIAFEVHRPLDKPSGEPVVFDATGLFGVNDCSVVLDSFASLPAGMDKYFDLTPVTYGSLENKVGTAFEWTVENLEGSRFNAYAWQTVNAVTRWGFSLYTRKEEADEPIAVLSLVDQKTEALRRVTWNAPVGLAGFRHFKYTTDVAASSSISFSAQFLLFCRAEGNVCPGIDDYPPVAEGQISPGACPAGFRGYSYRTCNGTELSEIKTDTCLYKPPMNITYALGSYTFVRGTEVKTDAPTYVNIITEFAMSTSTPLPQGLEIDPVTGVISGVPTIAMETQAFTVYGTNPKGTALVEILITICNGQCLPDGVYGATEAGSVFTYDCAMGGNYVGTRKRACVLGKEDGEWQNPMGFCLHVGVIVAIVVVVILLIVLAVILIIRSNQKKVAGRVKKPTPAKKPKTKTPSI